jgi:hypothetical protein
MKLTCKRCNMEHETAEEVLVCHGLATPYVPRQKIEPATQRQLDYIKDLGGNVERARQMTKKNASEYIDQLKREKASNVVSINSAASAPTPAPPATIVPLQLLQMVPDGYYAWQPDSETKLTFVRIKRPTSGKMKGSLKIQSQHGPDLVNRFVIWPSGQVGIYNRGYAGIDIEQVLLGIIVDYKACAFKYAEKMHRCFRCNLELTDPRSRHYRVGPECERHVPWAISERDDEVGYVYDARLAGSV